MRPRRPRQRSRRLHRNPKANKSSLSQSLLSRKRSPSRQRRNLSLNHPRRSRSQRRRPSRLPLAAVTSVAYVTPLQLRHLY
jgi:hypothetical protein